MVFLNGGESNPFSGLILEGLTEDDAKFFRDLRATYRTNETAQTLAAKLARCAEGGFHPCKIGGLPITTGGPVQHRVLVIVITETATL